MRCLLIVFAACFLASIANAGLVETRDSRQHEGAVTLDPSGTLVVTTRQGEQRIALADVKYASIGPDNGPAGDIAAPLPAPWTSVDLGAVAVPGSAKHDAGTFDLTGSGWGVWSGTDSGQYVYQSLSGDGQIIAFAKSVDTRTVQVSAGVCIRQSLDPKSLQASVMLMPSGQVAMRSRPKPQKEIVSENAFGKDSSGWVRLTRAGNVFTAYRSNDGQFWERIGSQQIAMDKKVLVGLVAAGHTNTSAGRAQFSSVRVIAGSPEDTPFERSPLPGRGVVLVDGTAHPGKVSKLSATELTLVGRKGAERTFARQQVAWIFFQPTPADAFFRSLRQKQGILLQDGDVFEGDLLRLADGTAEGMSQVFGPTSFAIEDRLLAAALREPDWRGVHFRTRDGTVYSSAEPKVSDGKISLGRAIVPIEQVVEIFQ